MAGSADIVLKSHVQPPEEARYRAGEYDEILAWLDWEFRKVRWVDPKWQQIPLDKRLTRTNNTHR